MQRKEHRLTSVLMSHLSMQVLMKNISHCDNEQVLEHLKYIINLSNLKLHQITFQNVEENKNVH